MRNFLIVGGAIALALTGCSNQNSASADKSGRDELKSAPTSSASSNHQILPSLPPPINPTATVTGSKLSPGMWETTLTINSAKGIDMSGGTQPGSVDGFGDMPLTPSTARKQRVCITADDAAKGAPAMISGTDLASCRWDKLDTAPGSISGKLICGGATDRDMTHIDVTGAMLPNLIGTQLHITVGDPAGAHVVSEAMMQGERVGDCASEGWK